MNMLFELKCSFNLNKGYFFSFLLIRLALWGSTSNQVIILKHEMWLLLSRSKDFYKECFAVWGKKKNKQKTASFHWNLSKNPTPLIWTWLCRTLTLTFGGSAEWTILDSNPILSPLSHRWSPSPCLWPIILLCVSWSRCILNMCPTFTWLSYLMSLTSQLTLMVRFHFYANVAVIPQTCC